jgi:hypothetical protein
LNVRGYIQTPEKTIEHMVAKLFEGKPPKDPTEFWMRVVAKGNLSKESFSGVRNTTILFLK